MAEAADRTATIQSWTLVVGPILGRIDGLIDTPEALQVAEVLTEGFASSDDGCLSYEQARAACETAGMPEGLFASRWDLLREVGLILPLHDRRFEGRYRPSPYLASAVKLWRWSADSEAAAVLDSLDQLVGLVRRGGADDDRVRTELSYLTSQLRTLTLSVRAKTEAATLAELFGVYEDEAARADQLVDGVRGLAAEINLRLPHLRTRLLDALEKGVFAYRTAVGAMVDRVLEEAGAGRVLGMLAPDAYLAAARDATLTQLAAVFDGVVLDNIIPQLDPDAVAAAIAELAVSATGGAVAPDGDPVPDKLKDPVSRESEAAEHRRRQRRQDAEQLLGTAEAVELTGLLPGYGWPGAAGLLARMRLLDIDRSQPYRLATSDRLVYGDDRLGLLSPAEVRRTAAAEQPAVTVPITLTPIGQKQGDEGHEEHPEVEI